LIVLHVVFAACAVWFLRNHPIWLIAVEVFFVVSFFIGLRLLHSFFAPLELIRSGIHYLREGEFATRFTPTGLKDMDQLVNVYNRMVDTLREERIHNEEQEHLLRKVMAESPGGVITLDVDGKVATVNPAAESLLGAPAEEVIGLPLTELGTPFAGELEGLERDESRILILHGRQRVRCQAATFMDRGFPCRFFLLDELTDELHRTEKRAYEKLIRMMSHEVNNTSGAVQSLLQSCLVFRRQLDEEDREEFARALEVAIQRTANLDAFMRGFADVVRLPKPRLRQADPWEIATRVGLLFRDRCQAAGIEWREKREEELSEIDCDPVQIEQALVNVVKNAVEAIEDTDRPGQIILRGGRTGRRSFLAVRDTGPGLSPEVQSQVFTPFYTNREKGQGIGLTMVQEILLAHGFGFTLENYEGGGAEFTIVF
jgi:nitrogen fixation/metabolism regulation signal transduction histidine kinase